MIDSSFMTTLPDTWAINQRYVFLAINNWNSEYERVNLGGLTCDSEDFYNAEVHSNAVFLPKMHENREQYIGFFHTGAYQESLSGFGGIQHCLIPAPKLVIIDKDEDGDLDGGSGGSRFHCRGLARRLPTCCNCTAHRRRAYGQLAASWRPAYCKDPTRRLPISSWLTSL